jgi:hypothetical protein
MTKRKQDRIVSQAQSGSQELFLGCPHFECLYEGTRGSGKTIMLIVDFGQDVGKGYGTAWTGVIFRRTFGELADLIRKSKEIYYRVFPGAKFNESDHVWKFPEGEQLFFRFLDRPDDYWRYHGWEMPFVGFDELCSWPTSNEYDSMKSICRSAHPDIFCRVRATGNPLGPGHNWVKQRFIDPCPAGIPIEDPKTGLTRVRLHSTVFENKILLNSDPSYIDRLKSIDDPIKRKAWLDGSWDIIAGGAIDDVWDERIHVIRPFDIPEYLKGFVTFAYTSGWRKSEIMGLTWNRVDRKEGCARLEKGETKNKEGRVFFFDDDLKSIIERQWQARKKAEKLSPHVFPGPDGKEKMVDFRKVWNRACRETGLGYGYKTTAKYIEKWRKRGLRPGPLLHDTRRSAVRNMVRSGTPEIIVMSISGHKTRATFDRYNIVDDQDLKIATQRQQEYLRLQKDTLSDTMPESGGTVKRVGWVQVADFTGAGGRNRTDTDARSTGF